MRDASRNRAIGAQSSPAMVGMMADVLRPVTVDRWIGTLAA
jgi:hypothetical protein